MLILPNYMKDSEIININNNVSSMRSDIYYSNKNLVVSKKKLMYNFTDEKSPTYVRLFYVYDHNIPENILNAEVVDNYRNFNLDLKYIITSMYDDDPYHLFGNIIYSKDRRYSNCYSPKFIYSNMQSVNQIFKEYETGDQIIQNHNNAMYLGLNLIKNGVFITNPNSNSKYYNFNNDLNELMFVNKNITLNDIISVRNNVKINNISIFENKIGSSKKALNTFEIMYITDALSNLSRELLTPEICTSIDKITFISDGENTTIKNIEYPFNKVDISYIEKIVLVYKYHIFKSVEKIAESFSKFRLICEINPMYTLFWLRVVTDSDTKYFIKYTVLKSKIIEMEDMFDMPF